MGVHPYDCQNFDETIFEMASHPKCVAIGECGLDYYRLPEDDIEKSQNIELQKKVFIRQIEIAKQLNKPLIVHIREATHDSKMILVDTNAKVVGGVLHCFNASPDLLELANHNFYFGIGGVVTFSNARKLLEILPHIPQDRLVVETDAPYLAPHPFRGERNTPDKTRFIVQKIADLLGGDFDFIAQLTTQNAKKLFRGIV